MLCTVGDLVEDVVVWSPEAPLRGADTPSTIVRRRGGSAANVATFTVVLGGRARFAGQVGDDPVGRSLAAELADGGVDARITHAGTTGTVVSLVEPGGERTMFSDRGAATALAAVDDDLLDAVGVLHVPLYSLLADPLATTTLSLLGRAAEAALPVSIDLSSVQAVRDFGPAEVADLIATVAPAVVFANRDEARALGSGSRRPAPGAGLTVVKAGPRPTLLVRPDGRALSVPVPPVATVTDTTGAGDAFTAAFLLSALDGLGPRKAAEAAHTAAARVLDQPGARMGPAIADRP